MSDFYYKIKKSRRRTLAIHVLRDGSVEVRAPLNTSDMTIEKFVFKKSEWIKARIADAQKNHSEEPSVSELKALKIKAMNILPQRTEYYAKLMGVEYKGVKITEAKTRWGSCSGKNSICFSCRLMTKPEAAQDYVIVHELAHVSHKNHGKEFWAEVARVFPDYKERRELLIVKSE